MNSKELPITQSPQGRLPSLRLTFEYEGREVRLIAQERVMKMSPPSEIFQEYEGRAGFWYDVTDAQGHLLYRRAIQTPIRFDVEVFSNDPKVGIVRRKLADPRGRFSLVVPDMPEATTLIFFSSPPEPEFAHEPAQEFARFELGKAGENKEQTL